MSKSNKKFFEKTIWIFWYQGWNNAPQIIKHCKDSWIYKNPDWEVKLLDKDSISSFIEIEGFKCLFKNLSIAHMSDLLRLELLEKYGGVWVDASLFCILPLNSWIFNVLKTDIFLFKSDTRLTIIANWFIAAKKNHKTIKLLKERLIFFWLKNNFNNFNILQRLVRKIITPILNYNKFTSRYWFNPLITKIFKIYPYQIFYFLFEEIVRNEEEHKEIWENTPKINKYICWPYQEAFDKPSDNLKYRIKEKFVPMLKLKWRGSENKEITLGSLLMFLKTNH